jgi:hypothetical protein
MTNEMIIKGELVERIASALYSSKKALEQPDNWEHIIASHVIHDLEQALKILGIGTPSTSTTEGEK